MSLTWAQLLAVKESLAKESEKVEQDILRRNPITLVIDGEQVKCMRYKTAVRKLGPLYSLEADPELIKKIMEP